MEDRGLTAHNFHHIAAIHLGQLQVLWIYLYIFMCAVFLELSPLPLALLCM